MMPEMNGYDTTRAIREDPRYASVPIIGITGNCTPSDLQACLDSGMTAGVRAELAVIVSLFLWPTTARSY